MRVTTSCPSWCIARHGQLGGEDELVHVGGELVAGEARVRICQGEDETAYLLLDGHDVALHEAETLVSVLIQLLDQTRAARSPVISPAAG